MPTLIVDTPEGIRLRTEIAGVGSRTAAALLDLILIGAGYIVLVAMVALVDWGFSEAGVPLFRELSGLAVGLALGGLLLAPPLYFLLFGLFGNGQTPGKRMVQIQVISADGYPPSAFQQTMRCLLWLVDALLWVPVPLGILLITLTPRCRRLGDIAAGTLVVYERPGAEQDEPWPEESWSERDPKIVSFTPGMAARLSEEDLALLRDAILRRDMPRKLRDELYVDIVQHYAQRLGFVPGENARLSLKELYLFGRESRRA